ncbi:MAG: polyphosphate kinase 1, partial [Caldilinea sp.]|nr:polyphosphate kinase 1 [Caldilinea sp.]MDW8440512.1 polyphosphate kinase 1 [Caldilineaceae bacterium]
MHRQRGPEPVTPAAPLLNLKGSSAPVESATTHEEAQRAPLRCITPRVPAPGALAEVYQKFLQDWERTHTLPLNPVYRPTFDLASLSLDALSTADEVYNRELSWLDFNWRVLREAFDPRTPLLERLKFIAITSSNLDEFFSKRVGGLKRQKAAGMANLTLEGWAPDVQLALIARAVREMVTIESACLHEDILPQLAEHGIRLVNYDELDEAERKRLQEYFLNEVYPILTPLAVDPGHPFPFISNLSLSLGIVLIDPSTGERQFARVKVPPTRPRWVPLQRPMHYLPLEQLIADHLDTHFSGMEIVAAFPFRVTR